MNGDGEGGARERMSRGAHSNGDWARFLSNRDTLGHTGSRLVCMLEGHVHSPSLVNRYPVFLCMKKKGITSATRAVGGGWCGGENEQRDTLQWNGDGEGGVRERMSRGTHCNGDWARFLSNRDTLGHTGSRLVCMLEGHVQSP
jgi:hypothetical protein